MKKMATKNNKKHETNKSNIQLYKKIKGQPLKKIPDG
jgi:hypothetical protein